MKVSIDTIRTATTALLDHLEACGVSEVTVEEDYYWDVPVAVRYDAHQKPTDLTLGQLSDDIATIEAVAKGEKPPVGYDLVWLAAIPRRCGETGLEQMIRAHRSDTDVTR